MSRTNIVAILALLLLVLVGLFFALRSDFFALQPDPPPAEEELQEETVFDVAIEEGEMIPAEITAEEGEQIVLLLVSDSPVEFHIHGYDLTTEVEPDEPVDLSLEATITGRFEIEDHNTESVLGALLVEPQ